MSSIRPGLHLDAMIDKRMVRRSSRRSSKNTLVAHSRRHSLEPSNMSTYEKWRLMLALLIYGLMAQWILLLPVILVALVYSICHRTITFCLHCMVSFFTKPQTASCKKQTILINGCSQAVALHLARLLNSDGHRVIACDFPINWFNPTRFSNAVDVYYTVPNPRRGVQEYIRALCEIAEKEKVDLFIPVSRIEDLRFDFFTKKPLERQGCRVFLLHPWSKNSVVAMNNNNNETDQETDEGYVGDISHDDTRIIVPRSRLSSVSTDSTPDEEEEILMAELTGFHSFMYAMEKFTSISLICNGKCIAISTSSNNPDSKLPKSQKINDQILKWTYIVLNQLGPGLQSGSLTFDLVISEEGKVFPISCGPYIGPSFLNVLKQPELLNCLIQPGASTDDRPLQSMVKPLPFCIYPELMSLARNISYMQTKHFLHQLWQSSEAFFDPADPLPFFTHYHLHLPFIMGLQLLRGKSWSETDHLNGKLT